jgi:hypothetical protein
MSGFAQWSPFITYQPSDIVSQGINQWLANAQNINVSPQDNTGVWTIVNPGGGGGGGGGNVFNPLTSDLLCAGFELQNASVIKTDNLALDPVSLVTRINVQNALDITDPVNATRFQSVAPQCAVGPTGADDLCNKAYVDSVAGSGGTGPTGPAGPPSYGVFAFSASPPHGVNEWYENASTNWGFSNTGSQSNQDWLLALQSATASPQPVYLTLVQSGVQQTVKVVSVAPDTGFTFVEYLTTMIMPPAWVDGATTSCYFSVGGSDGVTGAQGPTGPAGAAGGDSYGVWNLGDHLVAGECSFPGPNGLFVNAVSVNNGATQWLEATAALCAAYNQRIILTANQPASGGSASWRIVGPPYLDGGYWEFGLVPLTSLPTWTPGLPITFTSAIEGATGSPGANGAAGATGATGPAGPTPATNNVYYVAKNGNDSTADGSIAKPYLTIQAAINAAEAGALPSVANFATIFIGPGNYTENITMTDGYTNLVANTDNNRLFSTKIFGTISIAAAGANDLFNRIFGFQGLLVRATGANTVLQDLTVSTEHSVVATNCRFIADDRAFYQLGSPNSRNIFSNCYFGHENASALYTNPLVELTGPAWLDATVCEFYSQNNTSDTLRFSGSSYPYRIGLCLITNASTTATAGPVIRYATTYAGVGSIGQSAIVYESGTNKAANNPPSGTTQATGILFDTGARVYAAPALLLTFNQFVLNGLGVTNLNAIGKTSTTSGTPIIATGTQIAGPTLASKIQSTITHLTFNSVN